MAPARSESPSGAKKRSSSASRVRSVSKDAKNTVALDAKKSPEYTWEEVAKHNKEHDMWVIISDKVYDITKWVDRHPGGVEMLRLVAGRDITIAFDSYHPFTTKAADMVGKYQIGTLVAGSYEFPPYLANTSGFYQEIKDEVLKYFKEQGGDPIAYSKNPFNGLWRMVLVMLVSLTCFAAAFSFGYFNNMSISTDNEQLALVQTYFVQFCTKVSGSLVLQIVCAIIFGICQALPLLHTMHDCSHTAFGTNQTWWYVFGRFFLDFYAGCNMTSWHNQHTIGHHIYTNVFKSDPDLPIKESGDIRRLVPRQVLTAMAKYQHYYLPFLYGFLGISMRVSDITEVYTAHTNGPMRVNPHGFLGHLEHIASKACFLAWRFYLPLVVWKVPVPMFALLTFIAEMSTGYWLAFNFQVSHISTVAEFPLGDVAVKPPAVTTKKRSATPTKARSRSNSTAAVTADTKLGVAGTTNTDISGITHEVVPFEWAVAQTISSVDYSQNSPWTTFCCGALNFQIEHHLLPSVSQYHYPAIAPIVRRVCKKHGVKYNCLPNFYTAFYLHLKYLWTLGQKGESIPLQTSLH